MEVGCPAHVLCRVGSVHAVQSQIDGQDVAWARGSRVSEKWVDVLPLPARCPILDALLIIVRTARVSQIAGWASVRRKFVMYKFL